MMWKKSSVLVACVSSFLLLAVLQDGASAAVLFHGFLPMGNVRSPLPRADRGPNDIYAHIPVRDPVLEEGDFLIYPRFHGFEFGKDSEHKVYEVYDATDTNKGKSLEGQNSKKSHHYE